VVTIRRGSARRGDRGVADLTDALREALKAADPEAIMRQTLSLKGESLRVGSVSYDLSRFDRVLVIGGGKASGKMAAAVEKTLEARITGGVVNVPEYLRPKPRCRRITLHRAAHPTPGEEGVRGVKAMLELVGHSTRRDLVICLMSGGGSSLMPLPLKGVGLRDVQRTTDLLIMSGADIGEINAVRKHLSAVKGGRLAAMLYPAEVLTLVISDVVGDGLETVASGPTAPDPTTYAEAEEVLKRHLLWRKVPPGVRAVIESGTAGSTRETPKPGSKVFKHVRNVLVGNNRRSCIAAADKLRERGYSSLVLSTSVTGEAKETGRLLARLVKEIAANHIPFPPPACVVAGGETTVTVRGDGVGGRNQELVLAAALEMAGVAGAYVASMGTDGIDGPTTAAGAVADGGTVGRARKEGLDPAAFMRNNDSNSFFRRAGGLIVTGPTGTNVNDIMIAMVRGGRGGYPEWADGRSVATRAESE
jgi:glycerate 2-kinase